MPLSLSRQNILYFTRGNRVQYKNLGAADEIGQLSKLQEKHGDLKLLESGGADQPGILAIATTKGVVQVWDCESKKMTGSWSTKGVGSMAWNGPVLSMGGLKGTIRYYDTRIQPSSKMKEQAPKVTRHQAPILTMSWNVDGRILASGDESGVAHCWDARQKERVPLDVGEFVSRRKKIQHDGSISALSWCPWQSKVLATGDVTGLVKIWSIEASHSGSNATTPGKLELGSKIVNLYFSPNYKELLSVLGPSSAPPDPEATGSQTWPRSILSNSVAVHSYPSLRQITNLPVSDQAIGGSVLNAGATKIVVAVPGEAKLKVFDAWGKRKEVKRQTSFLGNAIR
ncbi:WD40 repeat-like protein [Mycena sp. CBHHK59/15]|nr:WD40 repeat-like protein [Mycena sp. CBHHK59/15]